MDDDGATVSVKDLFGPLQTLTVLVLAFSLVTAANSQNKADEAASSEADAIDCLFESADYTSKALGAPSGQRHVLGPCRTAPGLARDGAPGGAGYAGGMVDVVP
ncbi:hypothetical protein OG946_34650 [Streptomyces sp. NBC_01808]|uniref:hypothetical protein n=1 Tax=Streptomyces sp. NBC_01808 TaxID=2975947 RepID=UPI002DDBB92E|nr:hypothetical protein [Streptomyces sp. NBC_01808]WSA42063.1 hypothetical protein OG946_34650 [Streptomyces sp. NBC_01808]